MMNTSDKEFLVQKIRSQYTEKEHTQLDELKKLDKKVRRPADAFAYGFGTAGALVLGTGMSLAMGVLRRAMLPGILIGCAGIGMVSAAYPLHKKLLADRRQKYADEMIALSDSILESEASDSAAESAE